MPDDPPRHRHSLAGGAGPVGGRVAGRVCGGWAVGGVSGRAIAERLLARSERDGNGCLRWTGRLNEKGYALIDLGGRSGRPYRAHRVAYLEWVGPIPDGLELDHLCHVRDCIEPTHLEAVTHSENLSRRMPQTHCRRGHEFTPENTYVYTNRAGRKCRACERVRRNQS